MVKTRKVIKSETVFFLPVNSKSFDFKYFDFERIS